MRDPGGRAAVQFQKKRDMAIWSQEGKAWTAATGRREKNARRDRG